MRRLILPFLALTAGAVAATPAALKRAFAPPRRVGEQTPRDLGLPEEELWFTNAKGTRLHGWFVPAGRDPAPAVIVLHGWGGSAAHMLPLAPPLHDAGFHVLLMDARNHGLSESDDFTSMPRFAEDLAAAVAMLRSRDDVTSVGVIGHSVGAAASIYGAAEGIAVDAVVAVAPFAHPEELMDRNLPIPRPFRTALLRYIERLIGHDYDDIAPRHRIAEVTVPVLLIHGEKDAVIPVEDSKELHARALGSRLIVVPNAGHSDLESFAPYFGQVIGHLAANLSAVGR